MKCDASIGLAAELISHFDLFDSPAVDFGDLQVRWWSIGLWSERLGHTTLIHLRCWLNTARGWVWRDSHALKMNG